MFLNRGAAYVLVFTILIGLYVILIAMIDRLLPSSLHDNTSIASITVILLGMTFEPLRKRLQYFVDWVFYGGWYDYRSATANITEGFGQYTDADKLGEIIIQRLKQTLRLEYAYMLRISSQGFIFPLSKSENVQKLFTNKHNTSPLSIPAAGVLTQILLRRNQAIEVKEFKRILKEELDTEMEHCIVDEFEGAKISPILGSEAILGLLILGPKNGQEVFSNEDFDIVTLVSRHAGIALQNIQFLNELRHRASEINQLHQEIVRAREEERKRLSHELHDNIIQALIGLNFDLSHLQSEEAPNLRGKVRRIVSDLRQMCSELRPPTLDNLGLVPAIRSLLRELETTNGHLPKIQFRVEGDENIHIPEYIALNTYRVLSESLRNILRHAKANEVQIWLNLRPEKVCLEVKDDGCGFSVPQPLGKLLADQHFGLVGMRERVEYLQGDLSIKSSRGKGTRIVASIPLTDPLGSLAQERILDE
jgi:signal transduction histidine kinase